MVRAAIVRQCRAMGRTAGALRRPRRAGGAEISGTFEEVVQGLIGRRREGGLLPRPALAGSRQASLLLEGWGEGLSPQKRQGMLSRRQPFTRRFAPTSPREERGEVTPNALRARLGYITGQSSAVIVAASAPTISDSESRPVRSRV